MYPLGSRIARMAPRGPSTYAGVRWHAMYPQPYWTSAELLLFLAGTTRQVVTNIDADADQEIYLQTASAISRNVRYRVREQTAMREHSDFPMWLAGTHGDGRNPFPLPVARKFTASSVLQHTAVDESGVANSVRFCYHGAKMFSRPSFPRPAFRAREVFTNVGNLMPVAADPEAVGAVPAGGVSVFSFRTDGAAYTEWRKLALVHNAAAPAAGNDSVATIDIRDSTGYRYMNMPVAVESLGAAIMTAATPPGFFPYTLRQPALWYPGTVVTVTIQNLTAAALNMRLHFFGAKLYT